MSDTVTLTINGSVITVPKTLSVIEALWHAGFPHINGVGCLDGVCGSCQVLVKFPGNDNNYKWTLGCQLLVEDAMAVFFQPETIKYDHAYSLENMTASHDIAAQFQQLFPETQHCRHCHGCNQSCPKGIDVEQVVELANRHQFGQASQLFADCVMCNLCLSSCPEHIEPNLVGMFTRRLTGMTREIPRHLSTQIQAIKSGQLEVLIPETDSNQTSS
jgi:succinate dehydrogenase/fumarate reductase-like Fe-S protein